MLRQAIELAMQLVDAKTPGDLIGALEIRALEKGMVERLERNAFAVECLSQNEWPLK